MIDSEDSPNTPEPSTAPVADSAEAEAPKKTARKRATKKTAKKKTAAKAPVQEEIPEVFSADPDDLDRDVERQQKQHEEKVVREEKPEPKEEAPANKGDDRGHEQGDSQQDNQPRQRSNDRSDHEGPRHHNHNNQGGNQHHQHNKGGHYQKNQRHHNQQGQHHQQGQQQGKKNKNKKNKNKKDRQQNQRYAKSDWVAPGSFADYADADTRGPQWGSLPQWETLKQPDLLQEVYDASVDEDKEPLDFNRLYKLTLPELETEAKAAEIDLGDQAPTRRALLEAFITKAAEEKRPVEVTGIMEVMEEGFGFIVYTTDNYRPKELSVFVPAKLIRQYGLMRGHEVKAWVHPSREEESCPFVLKILSVMDMEPEKIAHITPFTELTPYYPTERALLETDKEKPWDNISMRVVDLLTPIGLGQRGLIVAPPRTGKTVLMQGIANALLTNKPNAHLIILLVDERPEEVTDFRRQIRDKGEVVSSTFDESAESHVHAAEMVIEKARRMVEVGRDVIILLDSITRLARAYNTLMPSSGKILSGGVEASALQKPKRFFGSARNIEDGGSLTILGTALVETGSRMDEVIFEEFKGTGNMELHLDRALVDKRIFPALSFEKSGTRKEEMLYHPAEMNKIYSLRRAMKGVPSTEAMEMLIQRVKKTNTNAEFLMAMSR